MFEKMKIGVTRGTNHGSTLQMYVAVNCGTGLLEPPLSVLHYGNEEQRKIFRELAVLFQEYGTHEIDCLIGQLVTGETAFHNSCRAAGNPGSNHKTSQEVIEKIPSDLINKIRENFEDAGFVSGYRGERK